MGRFFKDDLLAGKVALVTGGGSGICKGITRALMAHGARAVITSRKLDRLEETARELAQETSRECLPVAADVRQPDQVEAALDACLKKFDRLDIVVNGAAGNFLAPAAMLSYNAFRTVMEIDAQGTYNVSRAAFDKYLSQHGGNIINISATLHYAATPMQVHASAAKAAVDAITRTLAVEWGGLGIRVNGIAPGPIDDTEGVARLAQGNLRQKLEKTIPIGRFGKIDEIAELAVFLASDASSLIHGTTVVADGGAWLGTSGRTFLDE
ncbi:MAG TPA: SDR family oxidoreductase [Myxococcaceae bacterium]|nr:SDR family oxidoreductase [Myxococcaceae bacterium]